jgi:hypothetical protein
MAPRIRVRSTFWLSALLVLAVAFGLSGCDPQPPTEDSPSPVTNWQDILDRCIEAGTIVTFDDLTAGTTYTVGNSFTSNGVDMNVRNFEWMNGTQTPSGFAEVVAAGTFGDGAGGSGNELVTNNVNIHFDFGGTVTAVVLRFGEYGGNVNLEVNNDFQKFEDMTVGTYGGVTVDIPVSGTGAPGILHLHSADITELIVGGQEYVMDDVCYIPAE